MLCATIERPAKIAGGFVLVEVSSLIAAWRACRNPPLGIGDFRTLFAAREMVARRSTLQDGRQPAYGLAELAKLLGVTSKRAAASLRRLEAAGLIQWSESAIGFPDQVLEEEELVAETIGGGKGPVAIPRPMLRFLAAGARPAIIAVVLGIILRCLSRRRSGWDGRGRVKASWIARTFAVSIPAVKAARRELLALGWIEAEDSDQWAMNRWGGAFRIDLGWATPGSTPIPPRPRIGPTSIPPCLHQEPLPEREEDQEPARRGGPDGGTGVEIRGQGMWMPEPVAPHSVPSGIEPNPEPQTARVSAPVELPAPTLGDVRIEDLKDNGRLFELLGQAIERKLIGPGEADRLKFVAAAEHSLAIGKGNPPGLFAYLVRGGCWRYITQGDEDRANARLKAFLRGPEPPRVASASFHRAVGTVLSEDARMVREFRRVFAAARYQGEPFPQVRRHDPSWTRERWDAALAELEGSR